MVNEAGPVGWEDAARAARIRETLDEVVPELLAERRALGHWRGELSTSALSTATASFALWRVDHERGDDAHAALVARGLDWLAANANSDGAWGDTTRSASNISTTTLCWSALSADERARERYRDTICRAEEWLVARAGSVEPEALAAAIVAVYGVDRTFSIPILTMASLAGRLGPEPRSWRLVEQLPFELAACPPTWFRWLGLPVVSYALPALIAIGLVRHVRATRRVTAFSSLRSALEARVLRVLDSIQPPNGGFLEATPLTSFVTMSLAAAGQVDHIVTRRGVDFLERSVRPDGSWPIDTDLATWTTTLAVNALQDAGVLDTVLGDEERESILEWLLGQQYSERHPYTNAAPGAWAWTDLPGGVPDADDTAGALLAIRRLRPADPRTRAAARRGLSWLLDLQNRDGGIPTFCRGWGKLPFDRSGSDLTAHALRALHAWSGALVEDDDRFRRRLGEAREAATRFLRTSQRVDGAWAPLWFGNEAAPDVTNLVYGTSRALTALADVGVVGEAMSGRGIGWLVRAANDDGGWGGGPGIPSSVEETAVAVEAIASHATREDVLTVDLRGALERGVDWLLTAIEAGRHRVPTPIGFYFANLWYHERLYPLVFSVSALGRTLRVVRLR